MELQTGCKLVFCSCAEPSEKNGKNGPFWAPEGPFLKAGSSILKTLQVLYLSFSIYLSILSVSLSVYLAIYTMGSLDLSLGEKIYHFRPLEAHFYLHGPRFPLLLLKFGT